LKVISHNSDDSVLVELTAAERGLIGIVGVEFTSGAFAPSPEDWESLSIGSKEDVLSVFESLIHADSSDG